MFAATRRNTNRATPLEAVAYGAVAGFAGAVVLTLLARATPWFKTESGKTSKRQPSNLPEDPFDSEKVIEWQDRSRSPAAYSPRGAGGGTAAREEHAAAVTPAGVLAEDQGPGPEGAAEQFLAKLGSGLFDRDLSRYSKPAGRILHFVYGAWWGVVYGMQQGRRRRNPWLAGTAHGLLVWGFGPGSLVPAMRLMLPPSKAPKQQTAAMVAGHLIYGITVAKLFDAQIRKTKWAAG